MGITKETRTRARRIEKSVCEHLGVVHWGGTLLFDGMLKKKTPVEIRDFRAVPTGKRHIEEFQQKLNRYNFKRGIFVSWAYTDGAKEYAEDSGIELLWLEDIFQEMGIENSLSEAVVKEKQRKKNEEWADYRKKYEQENREEINAKSRARYQKNREKVLARQKKHRKENREKVNANGRKNYHKRKQEKANKEQ